MTELKDEQTVKWGNKSVLLQKRQHSFSSCAKAKLVKGVDLVVVTTDDFGGGFEAWVEYSLGETFCTGEFRKTLQGAVNSAYKDLVKIQTLGSRIL